MAIQQCCFRFENSSSFPFCQPDGTPYPPNSPGHDDEIQSLHGLLLPAYVLLTCLRFAHYKARFCLLARGHPYNQCVAVMRLHCWPYGEACRYMLLALPVFLLWSGHAEVSPRLLWMDARDSACEALGKHCFMHLASGIVLLHGCLCPEPFPCMDALFLLGVPYCWMHLVRSQIGHREGMNYALLLHEYRGLAQAHLALPLVNAWTPERQMALYAGKAVAAVTALLTACLGAAKAVAADRCFDLRCALQAFWPHLLFLGVGIPCAHAALPSLSSILGQAGGAFCFHAISLQCVAVSLHYPNGFTYEARGRPYVRRSLCPLAFSVLGIPPLTIVCGVCLARLPVSVRFVVDPRTVCQWLLWLCRG